MAKQKRVFEVAKELSVDSKVIVAKCQAEGVPGITNHMSTVKLGLEATIHEWFGEGAGGGIATAVETAEKVDLSKARKTTRSRARAKAPAPAPAEAQAAAPVVAEPTVETPPVEAEATAPPPPAADATSVTEPPVEATPSEGQETVSPEEEQDTASPVEVMGKPNVPSRPQVIKPMGEKMQKPSSAVLRGPKLIRVEKADAITPPAPRRAGGPGAGGSRRPSAGGAAAQAPEPGGITRSRGPVRGRGAGAAPSEPEQDNKKRRYQSTRRGRSAESLPLARGQMSEQDLIELDARLKGAPGFLKQRRRSLKSTGGAHAQSTASPAEVGGKVVVHEPITIKALSSATGIKSTEIIKYLFKKGVMATINSAIDSLAAMEIALEYDIDLEVRELQTAEQVIIEQFEKRDVVDQRRRPPVVTVLGHVDHGKTSLLDRIRQADVAAHEAGGITQHVGAYRVTAKGTDDQDKTVVFLDTPGHAAFTSMRARGASMTDLVVLVVAADDGVMPQTVESINHAKAAGVPIVVALNKIDKPEATEDNIRKIYGQLAEHGLNPVEWGGETEVIRVSATEGTGVTELLEVLDYQAELLELKADYGGAARGVVVESEMQTGRGAVARVLVQDGTIKVGDFIVIGRAFGRVREMTDDRRRPLKEAGPATPLELSGLDLLPDAGDKFYVAATLQKAEEIASHFRENERQKQLASQTKVTLDNFAATIQASGQRDLRVVLKADVQGTLDVLRKSLGEQGNAEVGVKVIHTGVGGVTESDVLLADASNAIIIGFHVVVPPAVRDIAEQRHVDVRLYRVIYDVIDDVRKALEGLLEPEVKEQEIGRAEVREVFRISKIGSIAGCLVTSGSIQRGGKMRVVRDGVVVTEKRDLESLRRVKDDAREVRMGTECGIRIAGFDDVKPGDLLICYNIQTVARKLA